MQKGTVRQLYSLDGDDPESRLVMHPAFQSILKNLTPAHSAALFNWGIRMDTQLLFFNHHPPSNGVTVVSGIARETQCPVLAYACSSFPWDVSNLAHSLAEQSISFMSDHDAAVSRRQSEKVDWKSLRWDKKLNFLFDRLALMPNVLIIIIDRLECYEDHEDPATTVTTAPRAREFFNRLETYINLKVKTDEGPAPARRIKLLVGGAYCFCSLIPWYLPGHHVAQCRRLQGI